MVSDDKNASVLAALNDDPSVLGSLKDSAVIAAWEFAEANPDIPLAGTLRQDLLTAYNAATTTEPTAEPQSPESAG